MLKKPVIVIFLFLVLLISGNTWAHHPTGGAGTEQAGPLKTISATTLERGKWAFALQTEFINFDRFSDTQLREFAENGKDVHSVDSVFHSVFGIGYGITDNFTLSVKGSYELLRNIREVHHEEPVEVHNRGNSKGIGDLTILGQYRFVKIRESNFESSLLFGLRVPTGKTTVKDISGERFETEFQPGTGSWDPLVGIAVTKIFGPFSLDANVLYTFATKGAQDTNLGDIFSYNAAFSYRVLKQRPISWDLIIEANGEWKQKQKINGIKDENSGENIIFISPGMRFSWKQWSAYLSVSFPVVQHLNGIQNKTDSRTIVGISFGL